jgi:hypothetical protein
MTKLIEKLDILLGYRRRNIKIRLQSGAHLELRRVYVKRNISKLSLAPDEFKKNSV